MNQWDAALLAAAFLFGAGIGKAVGQAILLARTQGPPMWWRRWRSKRIKGSYKWRVYE